MSFQYTVSLNDETHSSLGNALIADVSAAAAQWARYLTGLGTLDIMVNVPSAGIGGAIANGGAGTVTYVGKDGTHGIYENGATTELRNGTDPNGSAADIVINVNPDYLKLLQLDPNAAPGSNQYDGLSVFIHEIGHGLGIAGFRNGDTGALPAAYESVWDKYVVLNADGSASFVGPTATAIYGGPVSVTTLKNGEQYAHLANSSTERDGQDVMNGTGLGNGVQHKISDLDLAILKDLGYTITSKVGDYAMEPARVAGLDGTYRFFNTVTGDHFYTTSANEKNTLLANPASTYVYEGSPWATPNKSATTIDTFRFYDTHTGDHFYTTSATERDAIINTKGTNYTYEGIGFQVYAADSGSGTFALERFYNTQTGQHHFATLNEADGIRHGTAGANWVDEGKGFVVHNATGDILTA